MLKALFKKQVMEVNSWLFQSRKNGKQRSVPGIVLYLLLYAIIVLGLGSIFFMMGNILCTPLAEVGMGWLYFAIMGMASVFLGVFGSVFNTYATLYQAKDNQLLLSLPIPPDKILAVRLFGVWMWSLIYEALVFIPALLVYWVNGFANFISSIFGILVLLITSFFVLSLSCVLGWIVAKVSVRVKNKSMAAVLVSLLFFAAYYYFYFRAYEMLQAILANALVVGEKIKGRAHPVYWLGRACEGDIFSMLFFIVTVTVLFFFVYQTLSHSFLKMANSSNRAVKKHYKESFVRKRSVGGALLAKECGRFLSSSTYMLNCGMGTLMLLIVAVLAIVYCPSLRELTEAYGGAADFMVLAVCAGICMMSAMNDITVPSVSLEGKNIWLAQSLPIHAWQILKAKLWLHLLITGVPTVLCAISIIVVIRLSFFSAVMVLLVSVLFVLFCAAFGLAINLKMPNLTWTDEAIPVKQSIGAILAMFGGWMFVVVFGILYVIMKSFVSAELYLIFCSVLLGIAASGLLNWMKGRGAEIFASL